MPNVIQSQEQPYKKYNSEIYKVCPLMHYGNKLLGLWLESHIQSMSD